MKLPALAGTSFWPPERGGRLWEQQTGAHSISDHRAMGGWLGRRSSLLSHAHLGNALTAAADDAGQFTVDVGFELKEVRVAPTALAVVMSLLPSSTTGWARRAVGSPDDVQWGIGKKCL
jgi:hypothetical protein